MEAETQVIRQKLLAIAATSGITHYSDIAPLAGLSMGSEVGRIRIAQILDNISSAEYEAGRPLLSAIVVLKDEYRPGDGFFKLAERLGLYHGGDRDEYWVKELQRVRDCWASPPSAESVPPGWFPLGSRRGIPREDRGQE